MYNIITFANEFFLSSYIHVNIDYFCELEDVNAIKLLIKQVHVYICFCYQIKITILLNCVFDCNTTQTRAPIRQQESINWRKFIAYNMLIDIRYQNMNLQFTLNIIHFILSGVNQMKRYNSKWFGAFDKHLDILSN